MSRLRLLVSLICACALLPAVAAHAASVQVVALSSAANGIATGADGNVYVVEPVAQQVTVLTPDGRVVRRVHLPSGGATSAALGPDGQVWVALSGADANRGFLRIATDGTATPVSTAGLYQCGPVGMAAFEGRMTFTAPSDGVCGTHGLGSIGPNGELPAAVGAGTNVGFDLVASRGQLYVPLPDDDVIQRRPLSGSTIGAVNASYPAATGASPDGVEIGADGQLYITYLNSGQVARLDPAASNGTAPAIVGGGLATPFGLAPAVDGAITAASHDQARVLRYAADGTARSITLPAGFRPWQLALAGRDTWATDNVAAQVARIVDDVPTARVVVDGGGATAEVDPRGNDTDVSLTATPAGGAAITRTAPTVAAGIGEQPRGFFLGDLPPGSYSVTATAANARGTVTSAPVPFTIAVPTTPAPKPVAKPKKPTFAQVVSVASASRCLSRRQLALTLRKRTTGSKVTAVAVTIGKAKKAKTYKGVKLKVPIKLTGLPKGTFKVKVVVTLADRTKLTLTRTYKTCAAKKHR